MLRRAALLIVFAAVSTAAQDTATTSAGPTSVLMGVVTDTAGRPLEHALVETAHGAFATTSDSGTFWLRLSEAGPTVFSIRRLGYEATEFEIDMPRDTTVRVAVRLVRIPQLLAEVNVTTSSDKWLGRNGFYARQEAGWGKFRILDEFQRRNWTHWSHVLADVNGVFLQPVGAGGLALVRPNGCQLSIFLDGFPFPMGDDGLRGIPIYRLRAVEVYTSPETVPLRFRRAISPCGALVLWSVLP